MSTPGLAHFLNITEADFRLFDLGLALKKLPGNTLATIDNGQPYPFPHMGYGWLAILMWNPEEKTQNSLWFMKLPLDEQGIVIAGAHSDLVSRLYKSLQTSNAKERQRLLTEHPYQFKPDTQKMAALHAAASKAMGLPASQFHEAAQRFYWNNDSTIQWQSLGVQGIADFTVRLKDTQFTALNSTFSRLPLEPKLALLAQLEHRSLPSSTVEKIADLYREDAHNETLGNAYLRACAQSPSLRLLDPIIHQKLKQPDASIELLLIVITRYSHLLDDETFAVSVLDQLAQSADIDGFERVITNLAMQAGFSGILLRILGSQHLTETLANALGSIIQKKGPRRHVTH